jgi:hypothetical protein
MVLRLCREPIGDASRIHQKNIGFHDKLDEMLPIDLMGVGY